MLYRPVLERGVVVGDRVKWLDLLASPRGTLEPGNLLPLTQQSNATLPLKRRSLRIPLSLIALLMVSCNSLPPELTYSGADAACLEGDTANIVRFFVAGEANVRVEEIDGLRVGGAHLFCVRPGVRRILLSAGGRTGLIARDYIDLEMHPSRSYSFRANASGGQFFFRILDTTGSNEKVIGTFAMAAGRNPAPRFVPIYIPRGR